jgi:hypothetical protein
VNATHSTQPDSPQLAAEQRVARRVTQALDDLGVHHDIEQRLRVARDLAVQRAKAVRAPSLAPARAAQDTAMVGAAQAALRGGPDRAPWWIPALVVGLGLTLVLGLMAIDHVDTQAQIAAAAEIDAALLSDTLPPKAYSDAGFREFLRSPQD